MRRFSPPAGPIIDGLDVETGRTFVTRSPATGAPLAEVGRGGPAEIDAAVAAARKAFLHWGQPDPRAPRKHL
ncbi:MAG TPA: aldehyde dehydrogenase family protein, partial [Thermoanaerobaculia bacterium]|nr:aldehyde dehydrogenase family protein [Thermoanaerobaculia bacterium]